jgi:hypothetical protein
MLQHTPTQDRNNNNLKRKREGRGYKRREETEELGRQKRRVSYKKSE